MKKRNIVNLIAEIAAWIVVAVLLYCVFKIVDPIKRYNITWFDKDDKITQVETPEAKEEKVETTETIRSQLLFQIRRCSWDESQRIQ